MLSFGYSCEKQLKISENFLTKPRKTHQQILVWNGQNQLRCSIHDRVKCIVTVQLEDAEVHVIAAQNRLQHEKAHGDALEAHLVDLIFGNVDREDSVAVAADELGSLSEQQISIGTRHVKHETLRSILYKFAEELQHWRGDRRIVRPNLHRTDENRRVCRVNPVEEHHVRCFLVEAVSESANVTRETDECALHLLSGINGVQHDATDGVKCVWMLVKH